MRRSIHIVFFWGITTEGYGDARGRAVRRLCSLHSGIASTCTWCMARARKSMKKELKTLILEDVEADAELHIQALKRAGIACNCRLVETEAGFRKQLAEFLPDLIISDYSLPGFD